MAKSGMKTAGKTDNQSGAAAIFVVFILLILLALISIGFSRLMNREVRQALDRQLSAEAYYAAESGINDARDYLANGAGTEFTGCASPVGDNHFVVGGNISQDKISRYSCISVNNSPKELLYTLNPGESKVFRLDTNTSSADKIFFGWEYKGRERMPLTSNTGTAYRSPERPREDLVASGSTGVLRVGLYPVLANAGTPPNDTNAILSGASRNYFLYPESGNGYSNSPIDCGNPSNTGCVGYNQTARNGAFISGNCSDSAHPDLPFTRSTPRYCNSVITQLGSVANVYYVKLTALYTPINISVQSSDSAASPLSILSTQGVIDVTGSGKEVLRRVRAVIPIAGNFEYPSYGLDSMQGVCKLFRVEMTGPGQYGSALSEPEAPSGNFCSTPDFDPGGRVDSNAKFGPLR